MLYVRRPTSSPLAILNPCKISKALNKKKKGKGTGFELATSMTVDKRFSHNATCTNSPCDWYHYINIYFTQIVLISTAQNTL